MIKDDDLGEESFSSSCGVSLGIRGNVSSFDFFDGNIFDIESDIVSWNGFSELFVMHFDGFDLGGLIRGGEVDIHIGLQDSGFDSSDGDCSDTSDFVNILKWKSKGLVGGSLGGDNHVEGLEKGGSRVPGGVGGFVNHVISVESGNGDEVDGFGLVSDFFQEGGEFSLDFFVSVLGETDGLFVHFVKADDHLFNSQSEGEQSVFSGLSVFGNSGFEFSLGGSNHEHGAIGLRGSGNHIFDEISMSGGINNGAVILFGFEFPKGNIE